jgi:glycosyltransferase involved in cell wall biosynthesis
MEARLQAQVLHVAPSFSIGGVQLRTARIINHFGPRFRHKIIALDGNYDAAPQISARVDTQLIPRPRPSNMVRNVASAIVALRRLRPDLLVTYNWGSMEWAIANRVWPTAPHIHFEDGFGKEEADTQLPRRVMCRRWALARSTTVVVPSHKLRDIAVHVWRLPKDIVTYVPNGVDADRFASPPVEGIPGLSRDSDELIVGTLAPLRPEKNIGRLTRVFAKIDPSLPARLVIAGSGSERTALEQLVRVLGIGGRVVFTGRVSPETVLGHFDVFALSSDTEQMPVALLEAMAASLPVAAVNVGDVKTMVSSANRQFVVPRDDEGAFVAAIELLLRQPKTRERLGRLNRERVIANYLEFQMFERYTELFRQHLPQGWN